jgi:hypothetical protein
MRGASPIHLHDVVLSAQGQLYLYLIIWLVFRSFRVNATGEDLLNIVWTKGFLYTATGKELGRKRPWFIMLFI